MKIILGTEDDFCVRMKAKDDTPLEFLPTRAEEGLLDCFDFAFKKIFEGKRDEEKIKKED